MFDGATLKALFANLLITLFFVGIWAYYASEVTTLRKVARSSLAGAFMGVASCFSILFSVQLGEGVVIDLRSVPVAAAGLFGGPIAAVIAIALPSALRLAMGGAGAVVGVAFIGLSALVGVATRFAMAGRSETSSRLIFSLALATVPFLPIGLAAFGSPIVWQVAAFNFVGAFVSAYAIDRGLKRAARARLFRTAISEAPDYVYIKDAAGRLVAYNGGVASEHGSDLKGLVGLTDLELGEPARGRELYDEEQQLLRERRSLVGKLEAIRMPDGSERDFQTSKTVVADPDGEPIGLVGITRDITLQKAGERAAQETADRLALVLSEMADGVALYDFDCRLIFCNAQYHDMFPLTRDVRVPGAPLLDVLKAAVARSEQPYVPYDFDEWAEGVVAGIVEGRNEEVHLVDGRHLSVRNRPVRGFGHVSVVSDITDIRRTETRLAMMTQQLQALASTDSLTGLANRRALDELFERELARSTRNGTAISALMIDVDKFKAYNDLYGHQEGDDCLRRVGAALRQVVGRAADIAARYGGEEFCVVLADSDEDDAFQVADRLREAVLALELPHRESPSGKVTVSIGVAAYSPKDQGRSCGELLSRADQALYTAKNRGRNRVCGWGERNRVAV